MINSFKLKSFRKLIVLYLTIFVSLDIITASFQFFMTYVLKRPDEFAPVLATLIIVEIIAAVFTAPVAKKTNKAAATAGGCVLWIIVALSTLLVSSTSPAYIIYIIAAVMGVAMAFPIVLLNSLFADVSDIGELFFGSRVEGTFSGVQTFVRKLASAGANALFMLALGWAGFVAPIKEITGLRETLIFQAQPRALEWAVRGTIAFVPMILLTIGIIVAAKWPISSSRHEKTLIYLEAKRKGTECDPEIAAEVIKLKETVY